VTSSTLFLNNERAFIGFAHLCYLQSLILVFSKHVAVLVNFIHFYT